MPAIRQRSRKRRGSSQPKRRLLVEQLEDRRLLATINWDGGGDGASWNDPDNWDLDMLPGAVDGAADEAVIEGFSGTTITSTANVAIARVRSDAELQLIGGVFNLGAAASTIDAALTVDGATLQLVGSVVDGSGTLTVADGSTLILANSTLNADVLNQGTLHVSAGAASTINGALTTDAASLIRLEAVAGNPGSSSRLDVASSFTNNGRIELTQNGDFWSDSAILTVDGTLTNAPGGVIQAERGGNPTHQLNAQLDNRGIINVHKSLRINSPSAAHTNSGTINVTGGNLTVVQSGATPSFANTGMVNVSSGRAFNISDGTFQYDGGSISGGGTFSLNRTTINLNEATPTFTDNVDLFDSTVNGPGALENAAGRTLTIAGSTLNADVLNQGTLHVSAGASTINGALTTDAASLLRLEAVARPAARGNTTGPWRRACLLLNRVSPRIALGWGTKTNSPPGSATSSRW